MNDSSPQDRTDSKTAALDPQPDQLDPISVEPKNKQEKKILMKAISCWQWWFPVMNIGRSFLYDVPMILSTPLKNQLGLPDAYIQFLYSAFYIPPIFLNPIYGVLQKIYGPKSTYFALLAMIIGHVLFVIGIYTSQYWMLFLGRVFIGAGGECSIVSQVYTISYYSIPEQKTLMVSLCKTFARIAMIICYYFMPALYLWTNSLLSPMLITMTILVISVIALWLFLNNAEKYSKAKPPEEDKAPFKFSDLKQLSFKYYL